MSIFSVHHLAKKYLSNYVLKDVSFELRSGRFYVLMAPNGAGKSTVLRLIMGLERPSEGHMSFFGRPRSDSAVPWQFKNQIGLVAETIEFDPNASLKRFLTFYASLFPNYNLAWVFDLAEARNIDLAKKFNKLSRGQRMQIILLAEMAKNPKILLIDEITSILDPYSREFYLNLLSDFCNRGGTVLLTTNVISEVEHKATDILILKEGVIAWSSTVETLFGQFCKILIPRENASETFADLKLHNFRIVSQVRGNLGYQWALVGPIENLDRLQVGYEKNNMTVEDLFKYFFAEDSENGESKLLDLTLRAAQYDIKAA